MNRLRLAATHFLFPVALSVLYGCGSETKRPNAPNGGKSAGTGNDASTGSGGGSAQGGASTKGGAGGTAATAVTVAITPAKTLAVTGETKQFSATVIGSPKDTVVWTVQEGAKGGSINAAGLYTAPAAEGTYHVVATSAADAAKSVTAQVTAFGAGKWINVTPAGISLSPNSDTAGANNNFGAQQVVADSANPGTFLVTFTYQGVWKSVDFGATWTRLTSGTDAMDNGRPSMEIAPDGSYILSTNLYPNSPFANGCWKSVAAADASQPELGKAWRLINVPGVPNGDMGAYAIDALDKTHAVGQSHTGTGNFYESTDSGETWAAVKVPTQDSPARLHLIDSTTVLAVYDWGSGTNPRLGKKSGTSWTWTEVFTKDESGAAVAGQTSFHSDQQIFVDRVNQVNGKNVVYFGGPEGVQRSTDNGASWTKLNTPLHASQGIVATAKNIYSTEAFANNTDGFDPLFMVSPRNPGSPGSTWKAPATPAAMHNGWLKAAVATDGSHYVIVGGMWNSGLWIYIEP